MMLRSFKILRPQAWQTIVLRPRLTMSFSPSLKRNLAYPKEGVFQQPPPGQPNNPHTPSGYPTEGVFSPQRSPRYPSAAYPPQYSAQPPQYPTYPAAYPPQPPPPPPPRKWRFVPRWTTVFSAVLFTGIGIYYTHAALDIFDPTVPGTEEDKEDLALLSEELDELLLVKQLRDTWRIVDGHREPVFKEWTAYEALKDPAQRVNHFSTGPMAGSAGIAAQRLFWDEEAGLLFCFINFGPAVTGWPNVVHGGALATIADETLCRYAMRKAETSACMTANLEMKYVQTVNPGQWYVFISSLDPARASTEKKIFVQGMLACCSPVAPSLEGQDLREIHIHVEAKGLFVVPKHTDAQMIPEDF